MSRNCSVKQSVDIIKEGVNELCEVLMEVSTVKNAVNCPQSNECSLCGLDHKGAMPAPEPEPVVQARVSGSVTNPMLHLQYGVPGDYKSADVEIGHYVLYLFIQLQKAAQQGVSLAGSGRPYVLSASGNPKLNTITFGSTIVTTVVIDNPFL